MIGIEGLVRTMSKTYKLDVMEKHTYCHDVIIQVDDDTDIDVICHRIEEVLNNLHGDIRDVNYTPGVKVIDIFKDENPECECEVLGYKELLMFSRMSLRRAKDNYEPMNKNTIENCCKNCEYSGNYDGWNEFICKYYNGMIRGEQYDCKGFEPEREK